MKTIRDVIKPYLIDDQILSVRIVAPMDLDDPAILRIIVEYKNGHRKTSL